MSMNYRTFYGKDFVRKYQLSSQKMSKSPVRIDFFYDVISPYSYLAFEVLQRYKSVWNIELKLKPVLLGAVMKLSGSTFRAMTPNQSIHTTNDLNRLGKYVKVPLHVQHGMLEDILRRGSLSAQKFITAIDMLIPEYLEDISREIWLRLFKQHKDIVKIASFKEAGESIGMDADTLEECLLFMSDIKVTQRLRNYTREALDYSAFGIPMIVAHVGKKSEVFFGSDRFEVLAHILGEKWLGPVPSEIMSSKL